jgi:hypothetical protein
VRHIELPIKLTDAPENNIFFANYQAFLKPLYTSEPDQFQDACLVAQSAYQSFGPSFAQGLQAAERSAKLHGLSFMMQVSDAVKLGAINVPKWEMKQ